MLEERLPLERFEIEVLGERVDQVLVAHCRRGAKVRGSVGRVGARAAKRRREQRFQPRAGISDDLPLVGRDRPLRKRLDRRTAVRLTVFLAKDPDEVRTRIQKNKVEMHFRSFPDAKLFQIFLKDPDDVTIELNFLGEVVDPEKWEGKGSASAVTLDRPGGKARQQN